MDSNLALGISIKIRFTWIIFWLSGQQFQCVRHTRDSWDTGAASGEGGSCASETGMMFLQACKDVILGGKPGK